MPTPSQRGYQPPSPPATPPACPAQARVSVLQEHRFSTPAWHKARLRSGLSPFWPISCHFSELHQLGTRPHEHQDQPKGSSRNKTGGEARPSPSSGSKLVMKQHLSLSKFNLNYFISTSLLTCSSAFFFFNLETRFFEQHLQEGTVQERAKD